MIIFIDAANIEDIQKYAFLVDGVTTNPSLIAKEKRNFGELISAIVEIVNGPISVEVMSSKAEEIVIEAKELAKISPNIVIKIPMTFEGLKAMKMLNDMGIKTNATLIFSASQALLAAKSGATYTSIFVGRLDDISHDGLTVVKDTMDLFDRYGIKTKVITASIRHPLHVINAAKAGSHIATIPAKILDLMIKHPLTDIGIEKFLKDWNGYQKNL